ncbi:MAG TPA: lytic transglycosylase domain-containing protein [Candidatus Eisenbacteria bacterium]|jgi:soluble lytic murein transglycosylase
MSRFPGRTGRRAGAALAAAATLACAGAAPAGAGPLWLELADTSAVATSDTWAANPSVPAVDDTGRVVWAAAAARHPERRSLALHRLAEPGAIADSAALARRWLLLDMPGVPGLPTYALRRAAPLYLVAGDSASAESCWVALAARSGLWRGEALRAIGQLALARGEPARGDSLLAGYERSDLGDLERAGWLAMRARLALAAGDTARSLDLGRQVVRRFPVLPPATEAEALVEGVAAARGAALEAADERALAEVDALRGDRGSAARRLARALPLVPDSLRFVVGFRLEEVLRADGRFGPAAQALASACSLAAGRGSDARCLLERARIERDARRAGPALRLYARAAAAARDTLLFQTILWERAREAEQEGRLGEARADYQRVAALGRRRASDAAFRAGVLWYAAGHAAKAEVWWRRVDGDGGRFWRAIAMRGHRRRESDSLLAVLAAQPGYSFYSAAARDTLGIRGWPGAPGQPTPAEGGSPAVALGTLLTESGLGDDGSDLAARWATGDARDPDLGPVPPGRRFAILVDAAQVAFEAGRMAQGIRLAQRAFSAAAEWGPASQWGVVPWIFPPAYQSLVRWRAVQAARPGLDPALLAALIWQESRFDAAARSRSNALGLMQLMLGTARDALGAGRRGAPAESALFDPALNTRAGVVYLAGLLDRFQGHVPAALAAYNSGPGRVVPGWFDLARCGGEALFCELIVFPETEDYVKRILAARAAYRELAPRLARAGEIAP